MPLHAAHPGTRSSEVCPWPLRAEWAPQENREEKKSCNICLSTFNAVLVMLCWFTRGVGILLILACFSFFLMLSMQFLLLASHFHVRSVLDLRVWFFCCCPAFPCVLFCDDKIAHICGAVASIPGGLVSSCAPCMQRFCAFLTPLLGFSFLGL